MGSVNGCKKAETQNQLTNVGWTTDRVTDGEDRMNKKNVVLSVFLLAMIGIALYCYAIVFRTDKPSVATAGAQAYETRSVLKGEIEETGGAKVTQYGFRWGSNKDLSESEIINKQNSQTEEFTATIRNLKANHTYYYQAFAVNEKGTAYGEIKSFNTLKHNQPPEITINNLRKEIEVKQGRVVNIAATASDDGKIEFMSVYINDNEKAKIKGDTINYAWDTKRVVPGLYSLLITAWDGEREGRKQIAVTVKAADSLTASGPTQQPAGQSLVAYVPSRGVTGDPSRYPLVSPKNGIYGQFRYRNTSGGRIEVDPQWVAQNIVTITLPGLNQKVQVHRAAADNFIQAFTYIKNGTATINGRQVSLLSLINTMDGTYVPRHVMWNPSRGLSNHSWGTAIDINASNHFRYVNPSKEPNDPNLILWEKAFKPAGFSWGNSFNDSMHFELK